MILFMAAMLHENVCDEDGEKAGERGGSAPQKVMSQILIHEHLLSFYGCFGVKDHKWMIITVISSFFFFSFLQI